MYKTNMGEKEGYLADYNVYADQNRFLLTMKTIYTEVPSNNFGLNAVEKLFCEDEVEEILELTKRLIA